MAVASHLTRWWGWYMSEDKKRSFQCKYAWILLDQNVSILFVNKIYNGNISTFWEYQDILPDVG